MATVSKNIFWSTLTSALQLYTGSVVFIVLAKLMPVHDFGILSFGFSLSALAVIVADFGFSLMVMKDYPQQASGHAEYISNSIWAKMLLAIISTVLFGTYLVFFYEGEWLKVGALYVVFAVVFSFIIYLQALLKILNRFHKFTESTVVYAVAVTIAIVFYWQFPTTLVQLVFYLLLAKVAQLLWTVYLSMDSLSEFSYDAKMVSGLLKNSWSFGLHTILGVFYFMIDTQIISLYLGATEVALYQSVFRIVLILLIFSDIVSSVLLPYLSFKYYKRENISELVSKIFLYLLIIGCSLFLLFTSFKSQILEILYTPEYQEAAILVLPFSIVVILRTVSVLLGNLLTISNRQVYRVITVCCSLVVSVVLNLIFIPKYGIWAAAWISVLVHLILFGMYLMYSKMEVPEMRLFGASSLILAFVTMAIYAVIHHLGDGSLWAVAVGVVLWLGVVLCIMKNGNNFRFLQQVLREKGVG